MLRDGIRGASRIWNQRCWTFTVFLALPAATNSVHLFLDVVAVIAGHAGRPQQSDAKFYHAASSLDVCSWSSWSLVELCLNIDPDDLAKQRRHDGIRRRDSSGCVFRVPLHLPAAPRSAHQTGAIAEKTVDSLVSLAIVGAKRLMLEKMPGLANTLISGITSSNGISRLSLEHVVEATPLAV